MAKYKVIAARGGDQRQWFTDGEIGEVLSQYRPSLRHLKSSTEEYVEFNRLPKNCGGGRDGWWLVLKEDLNIVCKCLHSINKKYKEI
jgi:hypothetical protein